MNQTLRKYSISQSLFYCRRRTYDSEGMPGVRAPYKTVDREFKRLLPENDQLKKIVAHMLWRLISRTNC